MGSAFGGCVRPRDDDVFGNADRDDGDRCVRNDRDDDRHPDGDDDDRRSDSDDHVGSDRGGPDW